MKKLSLLILGLFLLVFINGCAELGLNGFGKRGAELLEIELFDKDGNLISKEETFAIVGGVPNVEFIKLKGSIKNTGNTVLIFNSLHIRGLEAVAKSFDDNEGACSIPLGNPDDVGCTALNLGPNLGETFMSGLIDVDKIGLGEHELTAIVYSHFIDEDGVERQINSNLKTFILKIEPDPIRPGVAVDISSSTEKFSCVISGCPVAYTCQSDGVCKLDQGIRACNSDSDCGVGIICDLSVKICLGIPYDPLFTVVGGRGY